MTNSFVQMAPDEAGKKVQMFQNTIGVNVVEAMAVSPQNATGWNNSFVEVGESSGKKIQYFKNTVAGSDVYAIALVLVGTNGASLYG